MVSIKHLSLVLCFQVGLWKSVSVDAQLNIGSCMAEDCDSDAECEPGLFCADDHKRQLRLSGFDERKANCGSVGDSLSEVCFDPSILKPVEQIGICNKEDCGKDVDCEPGLWCADSHKEALKAAGFDERKANCGAIGRWDSEVCFDPKILKPNGGGGGDPHFRTYDGTSYSYHGQCDLVMTRSKAFASGKGLDLHIRTEIKDGWSLISNAVLRIGHDVFEVSNSGSYFLNGIRNVNLPVFLDGSYNVTKDVRSHERKEKNENEEVIDQTFFKIALDDHEFIGINIFKNIISVRVNAFLYDAEGMLGNHVTSGMVGRDSSVALSNPNEVGSQWQINGAEPKLFQVERSPQYPENCILPDNSITSRRLVHLENNEERQTLEAACEDIEDEQMRDFCIHDVLLTGDADIAMVYGEAF